LNDIEHELTQALQTKYKRRPNKLRWAYKPLFLLHLLKEYEQVCYFDNDIDVVGSLQPIQDQLRQHSLLLSPHHYPIDPSQDQNWMEANFRVGLYNAGFMAVNKSASNALNWWARACLYNIKQAYWRGLFDDQKYLDLMPILDPHVGILHHRGCNVAAWNSTNVVFQKEADGQVIINEEPLIFIHFAAMSLRVFSHHDHALNEHYRAYVERLKKRHSTYSEKGTIWDRTVWNSWLYYLRWRWARIWEKP
jgi:lipopolysaccharide biosynthesis glycosyltransferase